MDWSGKDAKISSLRPDRLRLSCLQRSAGPSPIDRKLASLKYRAGVEPIPTSDTVENQRTWVCRSMVM